MSEGQDEELNLHALVGSLLVASAEEDETGHLDQQRTDDGNQGTKGDEDAALDGKEHLDGQTKIPDLTDAEHFGDEDLAAVVAQAIGTMEQEEQSAVPEPKEVGLAIEEPHVYTEERSDEEHWVKLLQQGILQAEHEQSQHGQASPGNTADGDTDYHSNDGATAIETGEERERLDHDDEQLRRAILESLQHLNQQKPHEGENEERARTERQDKIAAAQSHEHTKQKSRKDKKSAKKRLSKKERRLEKKRSKDRSDLETDILNFEDVIKGFMDQSESTVPPQVSQQMIGDEETQALVDATLKAFENELMGTASSSVGKGSSSASAEKKKSSALKKSKPKSKASIAAPLLFPPPPKSHLGKSKKKDKLNDKKSTNKKKDSKSKSFYDEEVFSKALAEMVNQVVNTSFNDTQPQKKTSQVPTEGSSSIPASSGQYVPKTAKITGQDLVYNGAARAVGEETFDLNQIMQNAMAMAFQEQVHDQLDPSVMEEFNKELSGVHYMDGSAIGNLRRKSLGSTDRSKHDRIFDSDRSRTPSISADSEDRFSTLARHAKLNLSPEDIYKRKFLKAAKECASFARKRISQRNKESKEQLRLARRLQLAEKRRQKEERLKIQEAESKELEEIVARGPPYPPDLKLTKTGQPKRPYRRITPDELNRNLLGSDARTSKIRKQRRKEKKERKDMLRRIPLSTLKKIPLFNFNKEATSSGLNDIEGSLAKIPLYAHSDLQYDDDYTHGHGGFDLDAPKKTVVHKEKLLFHPPWTLPEHPPYALPVARRRRKTLDHRSGRITKKKRTKTRKATLNIGNRMIPAALFPIINTLKAAARATAAAGATPEQSRQHLGSMLQQARVTIAQALAIARSQNNKDYSAIRSTEDIRAAQQEESKVKRIPLFSLANIKKIDTKDTAADVAKVEDTENTTISAPELSENVPVVKETGASLEPSRNLPEPQPPVKLEAGVSIPPIVPTAEPPMKDIVDNLVQQQLRHANGSAAPLPNNISTILSSTITNLLPNLDQLEKIDELSTDVSIGSQQPAKRNYRKTASRFHSVLNLDDIAPLSHLPGSGGNAPESHAQTPTALQPSVSSTVLRTRAKKSPEPLLIHVFDLPSHDYRGNPMKTIPLMRRVKSFLGSDDLTLLRREINKERKRKWREANVEKNRGNDLRSRLNQRANTLFGREESAEKRKWVEAQYKKRSLKLEADAAIPAETSPAPRENQTSVSDAEILNLIAVRLDKLEIAREIEREIQNEARGLFNRHASRTHNRTLPLPDSPPQSSGKNADPQAGAAASTVLSDVALVMGEAHTPVKRGTSADQPTKSYVRQASSGPAAPVRSLEEAEATPIDPVLARGNRAAIDVAEISPGSARGPII
ncbi:AFR460Cp [Eremothecium gossypii ATCC 10895]|uniref:AFR460Cp n=1 Tax=Eremothecium gossypii (strain ATCC 10895 / CBS 109.51 / FGSC 9923 / NRRL Y-1056) TaxID=284811 RepID=Q752W3_EREGS|nr:AFR460Cp [Eremothecium gossypii ATCC 10895]AAS53831.1 AFR460Cp [Eremothecium gossypii ATCC 10895]